MKRMDVCALFVISAGQPVLHRYAKEDNGNECLATVSEERYGIKSVAKSVTSLLFGRVFTDPAFGTPIDINATSASDALAEIGLKYRDKVVTIWDLLHMSSGMLWSETESCDITIEDPPKDCPPKSYDTLKKAAEHRLKKAKFEPGSGTLRPFRYSGFDALLIGMLVEHRLKSVPGLQSPLLHKGLEHFVWQRLEMDKKADWKADTEFHPPALTAR